VEEAVGSVLLSLGDGNWRMGDRMPVAKSNLGPGDEQIVIEHFMCTSLPPLPFTMSL
jgi:exocyst complex protein 7